jgi:hypothetical protein
MKSYKSILVFSLIPILLVGLFSGCSTFREKKLRGDGFTLMYKSKSAAGYELSDIRLRPVQVSEGEIRQQLRSLVYEKLSLFGKKKPVFTRDQINRIGRLIAKALNKSPSNKIIYYELETSGGATEGNVFASKNVLNWRFSSIQGSQFNSRSFAGGGGSNWRMVPGSGQQYHATRKLLGMEAKENWIESSLSTNSARRLDEEQEYREPARSRNYRKPRRASAEPAPKRRPTRSQPSAQDAELEKKLHFLKGLYEKDLVDEEEYNRKRKELLDSYL